MTDTLSSNYTLGIDFDKDKVRGAMVSLVKKEVHIEKLFTVSIEKDEEGNVKPLYIDDQPLEKVCEQWLPISGMATSEVLIRPLDVNLTKKNDIEAVLEFQVEPILPYAVEEAILDYSTIRQDKKGSRLTFQSILRSSLQEHLNQLEMIRIEAEIVTSIPSALAAFGYFFSTTPRSTWSQFIISLGEKRTVCVLAQEGKVLAAHSFSIGKETLEEALSKDSKKSIKEIDFANLDREKMPTLLTTFSNLRMEIGKSFLALAKLHKIEHVTEVLLTGSGALLPHVDLSLSKSLQTSISIPKPHEKWSAQDLQRHAIAIGLAIVGLNGWHTPINFRKKEFTYPHPWKRYKNHLMLYGALSLGLALILYLFGVSWTTYQENVLRTQYSELLTSMGKPYTLFEKEFLVKTKNLPESQEVDVKPVSELSRDEIEARLNYLEKEIRSIPDVFPLLPDVPRVSDVLAWLTSHPNVKGVTDGESEGPLINIESFSYSLAKRPDMKKKQDPYQVKIEVEFSTSIPKLAREFHDALIAPNDFIDPKSEIKWSSARDRYRTSFFLKNKPLIGK